MTTLLRAQRAARLAAEEEAQARTSLIEKLSSRSEAAARAVRTILERGALLNQLELQLADLEENAAPAGDNGADAAADEITEPSF
ncbi:hypothetical protein [Bradyrhizobium sp. USDA 3315]